MSDRHAVGSRRRRFMAVSVTALALLIAGTGSSVASPGGEGDSPQLDRDELIRQIQDVVSRDPNAALCLRPDGSVG